MDTTVKTSQEIHLENVHLNERINALERVQSEQAMENTGHRHEDPEKNDSNSKIKSLVQRVKCRRGTFIPVLFVVILVGLFAFLFYQGSLNRDILDSLKDRPVFVDEEKSAEPSLLQSLVSGDMSRGNKNFVNIGLRQDYLIQECQHSELKQSFPDMGYSLLGYNILRGYPLAVGHDPGFTIPIFAADYSGGKQTADCRYSVPRGVFLEPDVSCVTSFSSKVLQTRFEFASSLSVSAEVSGGGWGVSFSASAGYKESSSQIASGESVFILSTASCTYYFSKLLRKSPPILHPVFVKWITVLAKTDDKETYMKFFDTFGTHFPTMVTYGARYTYQYKMSSSAYETSREQGVHVAVQASYSGLFSVGGGFGMDSSQRESASSFSKSVETKTITVGAPPPSNGDAMTWASDVKTSPVPVKYILESIENLFAEDYMEVLPPNTTRIVENIKKYKYEYCQMLKQKGETESCEELKPGIELKNTRLFNHYRLIVGSSYSQCIEYCIQNIHCNALTYCAECPSNDESFKVCYMYGENQTKDFVYPFEDDRWVSNVFLSKINSFQFINGSAIIGTPRSMENKADDKADTTRCREVCLNDANCVAFSSCACPDETVSCRIYSAQNIIGLKKDPSSVTYFVSPRARQ